ncbi:PKD domain-containing protein [Cyclobacterium sp.]|uniref:PKD domain-containing protein n=1 Tax=Cyclobacterium sp. TaxID=1966343 RepID=UPI0019A0205A|nr:PKD domain-containing protein [Cyclobacterium sp.]MBD3630817.1 PKD domain-containing protein [Cyclobacterium sp.]
MKKKILFYSLICLVWMHGQGIHAQTDKYNPKDDPMFSKPYIDLEEWRESPVRHLYIHGGFEGTETRFSFYFPEKEAYEGHFFQYITPVPDSETLSQGQTGEEDKIGFAVSHGAYFVETNGDGPWNPAVRSDTNDPTIGAYKANAAAANYSKELAKRLFGDHRVFGYAFGGSGGAFRTIGGLENTVGVWDGAVPYVIGSPMAIPNVFTVRMHAMRILQDKLPQIVDAVEPGGEGMYSGLNEEEKAALQEVTKMGFPPKAWYAYKDMGIHGFAVLYQGMVAADPGYFEKFWTTPGYLGYDHPESFDGDRIQQESTVSKIITRGEAIRMELNVEPLAGQARGTADAAFQSLSEKQINEPVAFQLADELAQVQFLGGDLMIKSGSAAGRKVMLKAIDGEIVYLGVADPSVTAKIEVGDKVLVDNSNFLAAQTYHRHQVPGEEYPVYDQFRDENGEPIYPQRPFLLGPIFTRGASGAVQTGIFEGKMILLESLWDSEAYPWQADWYRDRVIENLGEKTGDHFRVWFTDHASHADRASAGDPNHIVSYLGVLQQALLDLSDWVENGTEPAPSTNYEVVDGQVMVPATAEERKGIQPVIRLEANGTSKAIVKAGESVKFSAQIELPEGSGTIVALEWDFNGNGEFEKVTSPISESSIFEIETEHKYPEPGTYFVALRATSQRKGDANTPFSRIKNLGRVRVVVQK